MYKANAKLDRGFDVFSKSSLDNEYLIKMNDEKVDGPMDIFTVAFSACILMCVKGYFFRNYALSDLEIAIDLAIDYDNRQSTANIIVNYPDLSEEDRAGILNNIKERCKISHLVSGNLEINYHITKK